MAMLETGYGFTISERLYLLVFWYCVIVLARGILIVKSLGVIEVNANQPLRRVIQ